LCGLIEEEKVLIVLNITVLNYIGLQFSLAQPPNEFVYILILIKKTYNTGEGGIDYEDYVTLCGLIEEEAVIIVLHSTVLNYIGLQFSLAQPPNEFVYILL
jgi:hypothetical protein